MALSPGPECPECIAALDLSSEAATQDLGVRLARLLRPGDAILLSGEIGAGKTTLVRALLRAATGERSLDVPSPTFTLVQSYALAGGGVAHHYDLWRLSGPQGLIELGWEDSVRDIVLVEWPERLGHLRPAGALALDLKPLSDTARRATFAGWPDRLGALLDGFA